MVSSLVPPGPNRSPTARHIECNTPPIETEPIKRVSLELPSLELPLESKRDDPTAVTRASIKKTLKRLSTGRMSVWSEDGREIFSEALSSLHSSENLDDVGPPDEEPPDVITFTTFRDVHFICSFDFQFFQFRFVIEIQFSKQN